jgi:RNA polymerase sigma-70 factor (ECF subfamily)
VEPVSAPESPARLELAPGLRELYATHFALVWRSLRRLGVKGASLEDAVQDVFLIVHRRWPDFDAERSAPTTWIYGITLRVAKDYRRAAARHGRRVERLAAVEGSSPEQCASPAEAIEKREANQLVHTLLGGLEDEDREVLVLVELEQLSVREAATVLGIRIRTCQRRLQRARAAFDAALTRFNAKGER